MLLTSSAHAASISDDARAIRTAANGSSDAFSPRYAARTRFCCMSTCSAYAPNAMPMIGVVMVPVKIEWNGSL